ncbi:MAG: signal recognition particle receptor subunit alpha, partial [Gemmatimonadota bacterium]|nr:signal recognition particle receptor subunit alpha [Gemmatimonadota bacterium]
MTFFKALAKSRKSVLDSLSVLFSGSRTIDQAEIDDLHDALILSDVGIDMSESIINQVSKSMKTSKLSGQQVMDVLHAELVGALTPSETSFDLTRHGVPAVVLMVGVNGVGKTTTCAKIAHYLQLCGHS